MKENLFTKRIKKFIQSMSTVTDILRTFHILYRHKFSIMWEMNDDDDCCFDGIKKGGFSSEHD
ncbi:hypothetical protein MJO29_016716 [Puccinia striiformis f. sp. tritici]|nr:hypothetical protein MJO29_016716 [Puccinia striiformis f. sp. tritici]